MHCNEYNLISNCTTISYKLIIEYYDNKEEIENNYFTNLKNNEIPFNTVNDKVIYFLILLYFKASTTKHKIFY